MKLDHLFIFVQEHDRLADLLKAFGLNEGTPNVHPGQGTACRRFFFHNAYLEIAWITNEEEAKASLFADAKLWERSQSRVTNYCPFGICLRIPKSSSQQPYLLFEDGWRYHSEFLPVGQFANIASNQAFPSEPLLFEMPFFTVAPVDYSVDKRQTLLHPGGFKKITGLSLTLPRSVQNLSKPMQRVIDAGVVTISPGERFHVTIELDNAKTNRIQGFHDLAPLTIYV